MTVAEVAINFDDQILRTLAWVFTLLSAVVSIALSIHRFGLSPGKRVIAILGTVSLGVVLAVLLISGVFPFNQLVFISKDQAKQIQDAHKKDGNHSSGFNVTESGVTNESAGATLNRISRYIYAVIHPNGNVTAVYNGGFFDAEIDGRTVSCELIDIGDNRVLIIMGSELETVVLGSDQEETRFKIQKVSVSRPEDD